ncbi:MAG: 30S ribosomal protein S3 [bacterium]
MSHKVHPKAMRIKETADWNSRGFYKKNFPEFLKEDFEIREFLNKKLSGMAVEKVEIERSRGRVRVIISSARPGLIIGRGGEGAETLKKAIVRIIRRSTPANPTLKKALKKEIMIEIREVKDVWSSAALVGQMIAQQIEKRTPFRRVMKDAIEKVIGQKEVQGVRVELSGRLNGVEISRSEWLQKGRLPRQTIRAVIDYALVRAYCTYGVIGVKVWIYKGEKFE